jgi:argininosuccinate lyase
MTKKEKEVNPLWGGRFTKGTGDLAQSFSASVDVDKNLFEVDIKGSIAYAEILKAAKILTAKDLAKIKKGLNKILLENQAKQVYMGSKTRRCPYEYRVEACGDIGCCCKETAHRKI